MKIAYVTPYYVPAYGLGGPVVAAQSIAKGNASYGHHVTVLTTDVLDAKNRVLQLDEIRDGVRIHRFRNLLPNFAKNMNLYLPIGLTAYLRQHIQQFEIVHLHAFFTYLNIVTISQCRKHRIPYVLHLHESPLPLPVLGKIFTKKVFNVLWGKQMLFGAARIVVVSEREKQLLIEYMPKLTEKIQVIPNQLPEDLPRISGKRSDFNLASTDKVILSLSRLSHIKRIDRIIKALNQLIKNDTHYRLLIVGPNEAGNKKKLEDLAFRLGINKYLQFLGQVNSKRRAELFSIADIYILLSEYESFSISTLEALSYGVPVCLSQEVGVASKIIPYGCGLMVEEVDNPLKVSAAIQIIYDQREKMSNSCQLALQSLVTKDYARQFFDLYAELEIVKQGHDSVTK